MKISPKRPGGACQTDTVTWRRSRPFLERVICYAQAKSETRLCAGWEVKRKTKVEDRSGVEWIGVEWSGFEAEKGVKGELCVCVPMAETGKSMEEGGCGCKGSNCTCHEGGDCTCTDCFCEKCPNHRHRCQDCAASKHESCKGVLQDCKCAVCR